MTVLDVGGPGRERRHADAEILGFRADGEWLVLRARDAQTIEEWSPVTDATRPSDFAARLRDATRACLSPDDDHFVSTLGERGPTVVRSRTTIEETVLGERTFAPLPPSDCAFSRTGESFALADERHVAIYRLGRSEPEAWIPVASAQHLTWSANGASLTFTVRDDESTAWLVYRWSPEQRRLEAHAAIGPGVYHARRPELLVRAQCEWHRRSTADGRSLGRMGPAAATCFHVGEHAAALSPTGRYVAAVEGEWGARGLVLLPLD